MNEILFSNIFLTLLILSCATEVYLSIRQNNSAIKHSLTVPNDFKKIIKIKDHTKAAAYTSAKTKINIAGLIVQALFLYVITLGGWINELNAILSAYLSNEIIQGVALILIIMILSSLIELPLGLYKTFVVDEKFGFNKMTISLFISDLFKQSIVSLIIVIPVIYIALWIFGNLGESWWIWLWVFFSIFNVVMLAVYPLYIAPLFNKFNPMVDKELKSKIEILLKKCGFESDGLFVMNGSLRSTHGNAYFTGFGKAKRIVFFDTLLERLTHNEILAVLAHELGHFAHNHVKKRIFALFLISFVGLYLLDFLKTNEWFYFGLGVTEQSNATALLLFVLISPLVLFFIRPIMAFYSRKNEYEADAYACKYTPASDLKNSLIKLYRDNASTLTPDNLYSAFYDSHPPAIARIGALERQKK
ncbi:M48 family metallopeptidase [Methylophilaceae bacterium]|jgi:STE24 endopeptidase|nr:M48 family metallopeptidase [Methylophilaceae bacterium]